MSTLLDSLTSQFDSEKMSALAGELGIDSDVAKKAVGAALPMLIGALSNAADNPQTQDRLAVAVNQHQNHDGSLMDNLTDLFKKVTQSSTEPGELNIGGDFLPGILGKNEQRVENGVGRTTGLNNETVRQLIKVLGPVVVGAIAKQLSGKHVSGSSVNDHLNQQRKDLEKENGGILGKMFDQDNDGDFDLTDIAEVVMSKIG